LLLITDKNGNVLAAWMGEEHSLSTIYPDNPEAQSRYKEYQFEDDPEVLKNPTAYVAHENPTGPYGELGDPYYELKIPTTEELLDVIRRKRDALLIQCDFTQLPDVPLTPETKTAWTVYRQALRDFPETCDVNNPVWPVPPQ
jgi:hypothetical protein